MSDTVPEAHSSEVASAIDYEEESDTMFVDGSDDWTRTLVQGDDDDILSESTVIDTTLTMSSSEYRVSIVHRPSAAGRVRTVSVGWVGEEHETYYRDNEVLVALYRDGERRWDIVFTKQAFASILRTEAVRDRQLSSVCFEGFNEQTETVIISSGVFRPDTDVGGVLRTTIGRDGIQDLEFVDFEME